MTEDQVTNNKDQQAQVAQQQQQPSSSVFYEQRSVDERSRRTDHWHFEKRLSLDTIVTIIGISIGLGLPVFLWGRTMEQRVQAIEIKTDERSKVESARASDDRDQRITLITNIETMKEQITQLRIDVGKVVSLPPTVVVNSPLPSSSSITNGLPRRR